MFGCDWRNIEWKAFSTLIWSPRGGRNLGVDLVIECQAKIQQIPPRDVGLPSAPLRSGELWSVCRVYDYRNTRQSDILLTYTTSKVWHCWRLMHGNIWLDKIHTGSSLNWKRARYTVGRNIGGSGRTSIQCIRMLRWWGSPADISSSFRISLCLVERCRAMICETGFVTINIRSRPIYHSPTLPVRSGTVEGWFTIFGWTKSTREVPWARERGRRHDTLVEGTSVEVVLGRASGESGCWDDEKAQRLLPRDVGLPGSSLSSGELWTLNRVCDYQYTRQSHILLTTRKVWHCWRLIPDIFWLNEIYTRTSLSWRECKRAR